MKNIKAKAIKTVAAKKNKKSQKTRDTSSAISKDDFEPTEGGIWIRRYEFDEPFNYSKRIVNYTLVGILDSKTTSSGQKRYRTLVMTMDDSFKLISSNSRSWSASEIKRELFGGCYGSQQVEIYDMLNSKWQQSLTFVIKQGGPLSAIQRVFQDQIARKQTTIDRYARPIPKWTKRLDSAQQQLDALSNWRSQVVFADDAPKELINIVAQSMSEIINEQQTVVDELQSKIDKQNIKIKKSRAIQDELNKMYDSFINTIAKK